MNDSSRPKQTTTQQLAPYLGLGMQLAAAMALFGAIGWWLDGRLGPTPWLLVAGVLIGGVGGMISIIRSAIRSSSPSSKTGPASTSPPETGAGDTTD
jgi:F0F1-type ATP synthase assembly protein I